MKNCLHVCLNLVLRETISTIDVISHLINSVILLFYALLFYIIIY